MHTSRCKLRGTYSSYFADFLLIQTHSSTLDCFRLLFCRFEANPERFPYVPTRTIAFYQHQIPLRLLQTVLCEKRQGSSVICICFCSRNFYFWTTICEFCLLVIKSWALGFSAILATWICFIRFFFLFRSSTKTNITNVSKFHLFSVHFTKMHLLANCNQNIHIYLALPGKRCNCQSKNLWLWFHLSHGRKSDMFPRN